MLLCLAPALAGCLAICTGTANPSFRALWNTPLAFLRPWLVAVIGSTVLLGGLAIVATRNIRPLPRWAYYVGGGLTGVAVGALSIEVGFGPFLRCVSALNLAFPPVVIAAYVVAAGLTGAIGYLVFASAVTPDLGVAGCNCSWRAALRFGATFAGVVVLATFVGLCSNMVRNG